MKQGTIHNYLETTSIIQVYPQDMVTLILHPYDSLAILELNSDVIHPGMQTSANSLLFSK